MPRRLPQNTNLTQTNTGSKLQTQLQNPDKSWNLGGQSQIMPKRLPHATTVMVIIHSTSKTNTRNQLIVTKLTNCLTLTRQRLQTIQSQKSLYIDIVPPRIMFTGVKIGEKNALVNATLLDHIDYESNCISLSVQFYQVGNHQHVLTTPRYRRTSGTPSLTIQGACQTHVYSDLQIV